MIEPLREVGDLSGPSAVVDRRGTVRLGRDRWTVEWGIGTDDRWHVAVDEVAVRQRLLEETPVTETSMRVPGGDVVQRVAGVADGRGRGVMVEFENRCGGPVTLAGVVRPGRSGSIRSLAVEGPVVRIDDRVALILDRVPGAAVAVESDGAWPAILAGAERGDVTVRSPAGTASGGLLAPLLRGQTIRLMLPVDRDAPRFVEAATVASGWRSVAARAAEVDVAGAEVGERWRREVMAAVMSVGSPDPEMVAAAAAVLDRVGLPGEADRARVTLLGLLEDGRPMSAAAARGLAEAVASRRLLTGRESGLGELVATLVDRAGPELDQPTVAILADALELEDPKAASDLRELGGRAPARPESGLAGLVESVLTETGDRVVLFSSPDPAWVGHSVDVRGLITRFGAASYSIRWHDQRPALLWQIDGEGPVRVGCGLDPSWSSPDRTGEALLPVPKFPIW